MQKKLLLSLLLCSLSFHALFSQCAGSDNTVTICNKELDPNYQTYNLFNQLSGSPTAGGTWTANIRADRDALNTATGIVDLWFINRFGEHTFTYTNPDCGESAEVVVFLGGYPGEDNINGGANACSDDPSVNLFTFLDNKLPNLNADINGKWKEGAGTPSGLLIGNIFNAELAGVGTYTLNYTVDDVDTCSERTATVILEVHRSPRTGIASNLEICDTDDLSAYTNVNLFDYLAGEEHTGIWTDDNGTGQIDDDSDFTINVKEIYDNFGPGNYDFTYTIYPIHGVCDEDPKTVSIILQKIRASFLVENKCKDEALLFEIIHESTSETETSYDLVYEIINTTTNGVAYSGVLNDVIITDIDGNLSAEKITLPSNILAPGSYTIRTAAINNLTGIICNSFIVDEKSFIIYEAKAKIDDACYSTEELSIKIYDFYDTDGSLFTGTKTVDYTITSASTNLTISAYDLTFVNGEADVPVDFSSFPVSENDYNFTITATSPSGLDCINEAFSINRIPEDIQLDIDIDNTCSASNVNVSVNAPAIADGAYVVSYKILEVATSSELIENTIVFAGGGSTNYNIDISGLDTGDYRVVLKSTQNDTTPCRTKFDFEIQGNFSINGAPNAPVLAPNQSFCLSDYHPNVPTLENIVVTSGENLTWYADNTSTIPLSISTPLVNGEDYYVSSKDATDSCESSKRTAVTVTILTPQIVTSTNTTPLFCGIENATIANLDAEVNSGDLLWYDSPLNGNLLTTDTLLVDGTTYYATESINGCESILRLPFTVTIIAPPAPVVEGTPALCGLAEVTLFDYESYLTNTAAYNFIWYNSSTGGLELDSADLLEDDIVYYVANVHPDSGCESERTPISINLKNCSPEDYDFFIPDGFSPNGDGVNDFYYIPNIKYFYPDYQLEIFNRYGQSLFKGDIKNPKWNGTNTSSKNDTTSGVYFYILKYNKDNIKPKQGRIYLSK